MNELVYIGLGSNLGDRERHLVGAVEALGRIDAVAVLGCSSLYDSAPIGPPQPRYLNAAVELDCGLAPLQLLTILKQIELDLGRAPSTERWGPRAIDLDVLLWGQQVIAAPNLQVPHLGLHERRFALEPLLELCPDAHHPVIGLPLRELVRQLGPQDVVLRQASCWPEPRALERSLG